MRVKTGTKKQLVRWMPVHPAPARALHASLDDLNQEEVYRPPETRARRAKRYAQELWIVAWSSGDVPAPLRVHRQSLHGEYPHLTVFALDE